MARITIEDCQDNVKDRFKIILMAAKRAREIQEGSPTPIKDSEGHKPPVIALKEIAEGYLTEEGVIFPEEDVE